MASSAPMSRGNRSSFQTSHGTSGLHNFLRHRSSFYRNQQLQPQPQNAMAHDPLVGSPSSATSATLSAAVPRVSTSTTATTPFPTRTDSTALATGAETTSDNPNMDPNLCYWRTQVIGTNSLYTDYEGGTLSLMRRSKATVGRYHRLTGYIGNEPRLINKHTFNSHRPAITLDTNTFSVICCSI
ncbi:MAG: hypothetical protein J3Q66DRAFT_141501 [Benniella sp.]|nr:MAG: hypothetical protein J3Q66DRAFT_141501 [Benniella sp.]